MRRIWISVAMLAVGCALMAAAQLAGAAPEKKGGIFKVGTTGASVQIDPQLSFVTTGWWLEYATAAKLFNYKPNGTLAPEVASRVKISNGGTRYTFSIRKGFRFSDGSSVTARNFKYAINRVANKELHSPGAQYITYANGIEIVGAKDVYDGRATNVRGVRVRGRYELVIDLTHPDGRFLSVLTMPFFQATSTRLSLTSEVVDVRSMGDLPSAGPYAFALNDVNRLTELRRNPYWQPGPGRTAPRNLAGLDLNWNLNEQDAFERVENGDLDEGPLPAAEVRSVAERYGVNKARFWVKSGSCIESVAFNNYSGFFRGNAAMRRAVNWALDRTEYLGSAAAYSKAPWTHLLPPGFRGSIVAPRLQPYAPTARIGKARRIAAGHFRDGRITVVYYSSSGAIVPNRAQVVRRNLINLGFDDAKITMKGLKGADWYDALGKRGSGDLAVGLGTCLDYVDPRQAFLPFGGSPWFPNSPTYLQKIAAANRLAGNARYRAFGKLDLEITRNVAPVAVMSVYNNRYFFSSRVDPRSLRYHHVYEDWSIPALALK